MFFELVNCAEISDISMEELRNWKPSELFGKQSMKENKIFIRLQLEY